MLLVLLSGIDAEWTKEGWTDGGNRDKIAVTCGTGSMTLNDTQSVTCTTAVVLS